MAENYKANAASSPTFASKTRTPVTLIFHGSHDRITDPQGSRRFHEVIASPDKTFMEFGGGFHELLNDEPRAEVRELILGWLRGRTS